MKTFCPSCFQQCPVSPEGLSLCCGKPAFVGCETCNARLVQLAMVAFKEPPQRVLCYRCWRREEDAKNPKPPKPARTVTVL